MMAERYKLGDIDNERFYMLPKGLFTNPLYKDISIAAKVTYALFKDRMELSRKNGWHDDNGDIYLVYPSEQIEKDLNIAHSTASKVINELRTVGLIDTVRQGLGKANIIYIKKFEIHTSESMKSELQEVRNSYSSDTEGNETEISDTKNTIYTPKPPKETKIAFAEAVSMTQKEYDKLKKDIGSDDGVKWCINKLNNYKLSSGKKYKNDYRAILSWVKESYVKANKQVGGNKPSGIRVNAKWVDYDG